MGCLGFFLFLFSVPHLILAAGGQALPGNWKKISVSKMKVKVIDEDTLDVDIDLNGLISNPEEQISLLTPCPGTPNCVSSQERNLQHRIHPIDFEGSLELAKENLYRVINSMRGTRIIKKDVVYWHVEFTTQMLRFIDDVEFYFDGSQSLIHVRSASRRGYWDLGVNRRRVETIRSKFGELTK